MGMDPVTAGIGLMAGGNILGGISGDRANAQNTRSSQKRQAEMDAMGRSMMVTPGANRYQMQIDDLLKTLGFDAINAPEFDASTIDIDGLMPDMNVGNDSLMQMLRADPMTQMDPTASAFLRNTISSGGNTFDTSGMFDALGTVDKRNIDSQVNDLIASMSGGGLGERFGSSMGGKVGELRRKALEDIGVRNAGIQQSSFEAGQGRAMNASGMLNDVMSSIMGNKTNAASILNSGILAKAGLGFEGAKFNAGAQNTAKATNASNYLETAGMNNNQKNMVFQQQLQGILQAAGLLQGDRNFNAGLFQTMAGMPPATGAQGSNIPGAIGDIGTYLLMMNELGGKKKEKAA